jgi:hypothetical protein
MLGADEPSPPLVAGQPQESRSVEGPADLIERRAVAMLIPNPRNAIEIAS